MREAVRSEYKVLVNHEVKVEESYGFTGLSFDVQADAFAVKVSCRVNHNVHVEIRTEEVGYVALELVPLTVFFVFH